MSPQPDGWWMDEVGLTAVAVALLLASAITARAGYRFGRRQAAVPGKVPEPGPHVVEATTARLSRAARLAGIGEYWWNVDTGALWWSENSYRLFGLDPSQPVTIEQAFGAIHPDDAEAMRRATDELLAGGPPTEHQLRIVRPDGSVRHVLSWGELHDESGQRCVFGVLKDVSDLVAVTRRLDAARSQYHFVFELNPIPMWVIDTETLNFLVVNDATLRTYGYAREELIGHHLLTLCPPGELDVVREALKHPLAEYRQGDVWTHVCRDGRLLRAAVFAHDIEFEGRPARLVAAQDVTERERNEDRFRMIARATNDVVYDFDVGSNRLWWSDSYSTVFGHPQHQAPATLDDWAALVHPDDIGPVNASLEASLASNAEEWSAEYRFRRADGSYATVTERGLIARDADGRAVRMVGGLLDATAQRQSEARLHLLTRAVESADNGLVITDARQPDLPVVYVNPAFERMTGYTLAEIEGHNPRMLQREDRDQAGIHSIRQCLAQQHEVRTLLRNYRKDGTLFWNEMYISPVRDEAGTLTHFVGVLNDVSERHNYEERLAHRATHDELTGLPNRLLLDDRLEHAIHASDRYDWRTTVVFVDLDDFKLLNDSLGHGAGDAALREIARRLQHVVRESDTVARFGGDEFVAVLTAPAHDDDPAEVIRRIIDTLAQPLEVGGVSHILTASIGYSTYPDDGHTPETLLRQADLAMYQAKRRGRNRAIAYRPEFGTNVSRRLQLVHQLREGLERDEFVLAFQPLFAPDGRVLALEALVRWQHPTRGLLPPGEFIATCEQSGLIVELGRRVLHLAACHYARLVSAGLGHLRIAVNVSAAQFTDDLHADVESAMREHALPPGVLELELTESVIMESPAHAIELMKRIAALGVSFSVDDFGTGYSSLAYLKRFPIERLKIDRSFVQDLGDNNDDAAICQSIISLAQALDISTVAEGVETEQQRAWLSERGCDELQGFLLARPQPFDVLLPWLRAAMTAA